MNSGRNVPTAFSDIEQHMVPPPAPMPMPEQTIERQRRSAGFFGLFSLFLFPAK